jgi:hypothetical protein
MHDLMLCQKWHHRTDDLLSPYSAFGTLAPSTAVQQRSSVLEGAADQKTMFDHV